MSISPHELAVQQAAWIAERRLGTLSDWFVWSSFVLRDDREVPPALMQRWIDRRFQVHGDGAHGLPPFDEYPLMIISYGTREEGGKEIMNMFPSIRSFGPWRDPIRFIPENGIPLIDLENLPSLARRPASCPRVSSGLNEDYRRWINQYWEFEACVHAGIALGMTHQLLFVCCKHGHHRAPSCAQEVYEQLQLIGRAAEIYHIDDRTVGLGEVPLERWDDIWERIGL